MRRVRSLNEKKKNYIACGLFAAQLEHAIYYEVIISNVCNSLQ